MGSKWLSVLEGFTCKIGPINYIIFRLRIFLLPVKSDNNISFNVKQLSATKQKPLCKDVIRCVGIRGNEVVSRWSL